MSKDTELLDCLRSFGKLILMVVIFGAGSCAEYFPKNSYHIRLHSFHFHCLYISHINQFHLHDIHLLPVMYISYIIYSILHSRCYTGVRAPKLLHRSSYIKEPWEGLGRASRGLDGAFRRAWRRLAGLETAWEGLEGGLKVKASKRAWRGLEKGFKGASEGLQGGLRRASRGLQGGFKPFSPSAPPPPVRDPSSPPWRVPSRWWLGSSPEYGRLRTHILQGIMHVLLKKEKWQLRHTFIVDTIARTARPIESTTSRQHGHYWSMKKL